MTILQAIILGIIQGLTEFLPISSSGHLVILPYLLGWEIPIKDAFVFDVLVQVATLLAVITYFWRDLVDIVKSMLSNLAQKEPFKDPPARLGWYILLSTLPAGLIGLFLKEYIERAFASPIASAIALLLTAGLLVLAEQVGRRNRALDKINWIDSIWIGAFQALAIFPGVSRSSATISGGMTRNLERPAAARFAFLMSIPIMLAAGLLATYDLMQIPNFASRLPTFIPGFIAAAVVGYLSIRWLLGFLNQRPLYIFAIYCTTLALLTISVFFVKG